MTAYNARASAGAISNFVLQADALLRPRVLYRLLNPTMRLIEETISATP